MKSPLKPNALRPGDTIAIVSPASPTPEAPAALEKGRLFLESLGYHINIMPHAGERWGYLAGSDEARLADLQQAFADPDIHAILCARGGYGAMRLLSEIDYTLITKNPKIFIGFSDITALITAFYQEAGLVGFYGPMLTSNLVTQNPFDLNALFPLLRGETKTPIGIPNADAYHCFRPGIAEGPLIGGNLSLVAALCGTPYQLNAQGHILFLEDWKEKYYSLDRQFQQLKLAGIFFGIRGLLLCDFSQIEPEPDWDLVRQLRFLTAELDVPVGFGFSVGHGEQTATLPVGIPARFNAEHGTLTLLESPVLF